LSQEIRLNAPPPSPPSLPSKHLVQLLLNVSSPPPQQPMVQTSMEDSIQIMEMSVGVPVSLSCEICVSNKHVFPPHPVKVYIICMNIYIVEYKNSTNVILQLHLQYIIQCKQIKKKSH